jgi:hypothetical protein
MQHGSLKSLNVSDTFLVAFHTRAVLPSILPPSDTGGNTNVVNAPIERIIGVLLGRFERGMGEFLIKERSRIKR